MNAFFIREDYASRFESGLVNPMAWPSKFRESLDEAGQLSFVGGLERAQLIRELPVINTETLEKQPLRGLTPLYSEDWLRILEPRIAQGMARKANFIKSRFGIICQVAARRGLSTTRLVGWLRGATKWKRGVLLVRIENICP